jgi:hypothetical protein
MDDSLIKKDIDNYVFIEELRNTILIIAYSYNKYRRFRELNQKYYIPFQKKISLMNKKGKTRNGSNK